MIKNENNDVAVCYYQTTPKVIKVNRREYAFVVRANICLAWVREEDVDAMLRTKKTCCGGNTRKVCRVASETDVRRWSQGGGR